MTATIYEYLANDHARLDALLVRTTADADTIDDSAYAEFRAGLLRHIAMEEKVLFADARARDDRELHEIIRVLHADHAAIASLLVAPPTHALIATLRSVLDEHNPLEEGEDGLYARCDGAAGGDSVAVIARMEAIAPVRVSQFVDEPRVHAHIERMLAARQRRP